METGRRMGERVSSSGVVLRTDAKRKKKGEGKERDEQAQKRREETERRVAELEEAALEPATRKTYRAGMTNWTKYAEEQGVGRDETPEELTLMLFVGWMTKDGKGKRSEGMSSKTIGVYLAAVRDHVIRRGEGCILEGKLRLQRVVRGWKKLEGKRVDQRRPVTVALLKEAACLVSWNAHDQVLAWLVAVWGVLGLFRMGELLPTSKKDSKHAQIREKDVRVSGSGDEISIDLRASKTDAFRKGVTVIMQGGEREEEKMCPIRVWRRVKQLRKERKESERGDEEAVMRKQNGDMLTRKEVVEVMTVWFEEVDRKKGIKTEEKFNGHSLRKGGATSLFLRGVSETLIQVLGRWKSDAYKAYGILNREVVKKAQREMMQSKEGDLVVGKTRWSEGYWRTDEHVEEEEEEAEEQHEGEEVS